MPFAKHSGGYEHAQWTLDIGDFCFNVLIDSFLNLVKICIHLRALFGMEICLLVNYAFQITASHCFRSVNINASAFS